MYQGHPGLWMLSILVGFGLAFWGRCKYVDSAYCRNQTVRKRVLKNGRRIMMFGLSVIAFAFFLTPFPNDPFAMPTEVAFFLAFGIVFLVGGTLRYLEGPNP